MSLSHRPHPPRRFVENKGSTSIRPSGDRAVESPFLRFSAVESGPISGLFFRFYLFARQRVANFKKPRGVTLNISSSLRPKAETLSEAEGEGTKLAQSFLLGARLS
jgi:hypothetical protein